MCQDQPAGGSQEPSASAPVLSIAAWQNREIDSTHMHTYKKLGYLLTFVDIFTDWIESVPTSRETLMDVVAHSSLVLCACRRPLKQTTVQPSPPWSMSSCMKLSTSPGNSVSLYNPLERLREPIDSSNSSLLTLSGAQVILALPPHHNPYLPPGQP